MYEHLSQVEKATGVRDSRLDTVPPFEYAELWQIYWHVRHDGSFSLSELHAYRELTGVVIEKFEVKELLMIDAFVQTRIRYHENSNRKN